VEVRTVQDHGGRETLGAFFTSPIHDLSTREASTPVAVREGEYVVKVTEYVEAVPVELHSTSAKPVDGTPLPWRYYMVLETENGNVTVTEKLEDGREVRMQNPEGLEARCISAKVVSCADCRGTNVTLRDALKAATRAEAD